MKVSELVKLKPGTKIKLSRGKKFRDFYIREAWFMTIGSRPVKSEADLQEYVNYLMIGNCLETGVKFLQYSNNVGNNVPGAYVEIRLPGKQIDRCYLEHTHLRLAK